MARHHYRNRQRLGYEASFLFAIAADAESYPQFVPWCEAVRLVKKSAHSHVALVTFGYRHLNYRFHSHNQWRTPDGGGDDDYVVEAKSDETPFRHLYSRWRLTPVGNNETEVDFYMEYELRSALLDGLLSRLWRDVSERMIDAFRQRARSLHEAQQSQL